MAGQFEFGNVQECWTIKDGKPTYWFVGHFIPSGLRHTNCFNVKWGIHQPADGVLERANETGPLTVSVLLRGRMTYWLRAHGTEEWEERLLETPGDFVIWEPGIDHKYEAHEDNTTLITVRKDQPQSKWRRFLARLCGC